MKTEREAALDLAVRDVREDGVLRSYIDSALEAPIETFGAPGHYGIHGYRHTMYRIRTRFKEIWEADHAPIYQECAESAKRGLIASGREFRARKISELFGGSSDD